MVDLDHSHVSVASHLGPEALPNSIQVWVKAPPVHLRPSNQPVPITLPITLVLRLLRSVFRMFVWEKYTECNLFDACASECLDTKTVCAGIRHPLVLIDEGSKAWEDAAHRQW